MKCVVCGLEYGLSYTCSGVAPALSPEEAAPPPEGFAPLYYARMAFGIVRWDDVAIRRASRDPRAIFYGAFAWTCSALLVLVVSTLPALLRRLTYPAPALLIGLFIGFLVGLFVMALLTFTQLGLCHLIAKWFFEANGSFMAIMRPLLLAWFVNVLMLIPVVGLLAAGIAWTAVLMLVFEEVDGIGRLQAFLISAGINVVFFAVQFMLPIRA
jgi:hypothetical protein